ncbi:hypothetical protein FOA52_014146 [Chlamydomonas sp. UWO 241]|nr:hypothetical protein FOA52_014146 [Chlamydomonas sp. UWO 241]
MASEVIAKRLWLEEDLGDDYRWSYRVTKVLFSGKSEFQEVDLVDTPTFGKESVVVGVLLLDGKMQSTESDEEVYHELLVHPTLLQHPNPKSVFIMGGGEGATAREVLRHTSVEQVVMVDIDKVVTDFCCEHLTRNTAAFNDPRLKLINDDARTQLEQWPGTFDVIIGDLADPLDGGPCYQLYTQEFYQTVVIPKLNPGGIFITQSGPAGFNSCDEVFSLIHNTLRHSSFGKVVPYAQHIPSFCDIWGYNMAFVDASTQVLEPAELDARAAARISGPPLKFLDGQTLQGLLLLNKMVRKALAEETDVFTKDTARFIHGAGVKNCHSTRLRSSSEAVSVTAPGGTESADIIMEAVVPSGRLEISQLRPDEVQSACVVMARAFATTDEEITLTGATQYVRSVLGHGPLKSAFLIARLFPNDPSLLPPKGTSRVVGTVVISLHPDTMQPCPSQPPPAGSVYLSNMAVDTKLRRQGIARALLAAASSVARDAGRDAIYLHVKQSDPGPQALYGSNGYAEVSRDNMLVKLQGVAPRILMRTSL